MKRCISLSWHLQSCQKCFRKLVLQHLKWFISFCRNLTQKLCPIEFLKFMHLLKSLKCSIKNVFQNNAHLSLSVTAKNQSGILSPSSANRPLTSRALSPHPPAILPRERWSRRNWYKFLIGPLIVHNLTSSLVSSGVISYTGGATGGASSLYTSLGFSITPFGLCMETIELRNAPVLEAQCAILGRRRREGRGTCPRQPKTLGGISSWNHDFFLHTYNDFAFTQHF